MNEFSFFVVLGYIFVASLGYAILNFAIYAYIYRKRTGKLYKALLIGALFCCAICLILFGLLIYLK